MGEKGTPYNIHYYALNIKPSMTEIIHTLDILLDYYIIS